MKNKFVKRHVLSISLPFALTACALLAGCNTPPKPLYQWESYQPQVYEYFKGQASVEQVTVLERDLQKIRAAGNMPPPGYHAQLGMLYASLGKEEQVVQEFQTEKELFPESSAYMDFLMRKFKK
ncbi:DUF4810 domain-containing protein [Collimonas sp.]|jgi:hypothetical protein|uniref:DUF4810 domain-containing protein n=1 Tax=Collimonas sp. TaxID=1963772 RepID=UPI002BCC424A|nr:DUF4810 domain-containing protein [Collimonas sp.]HWW04362.1 DUF4810 domain-containing protein [Collimonas sp.]